MSNRALVSYSAIITLTLICLLIVGGRLNRKIEYPQSAKAYAGLAVPGKRSYADTGQSRRQIMEVALKRCNEQCRDSYYYSTVEFYNACKSTCFAVWADK